MKNRHLFALLAVVFVGLLSIALFIPGAHAQEASSEISLAPLDAAKPFVEPVILGFAQSHPWLVTVLAVVGALRLLLKPIVSLAQTFVQITTTPADDLALAKIEGSKAWHVFAYVVDWLGSLKVGPRFKAGAQPVDPKADKGD